MRERLPPAEPTTEDERLFRTFAAAMPQLAWTSTFDADTDSFNPAWYAFTGQPTDLTGAAAWNAALHPDEATAVIAASKAIRLTGEAFALEARLRRADGTWRWHHLQSRPVTHPEGPVRFRLGTATDIHEQKLALRRLEDSEQRLALALESSNLGTWEWDITSDVLSFDLRCEQIFGMPPRSFRGTFRTDFPRFVHPDDRELVLSHVDAAVRGRTAYRLEYRTVWPDGGIHWVRALGRAYYGETTGRPTRMVGTVANIDARKNQEARFELVLEAAGLGLWYCDLPGELVHCNAIYRSLHGLPAEGEVRADAVRRRMHPDDVARVDEAVRRALEERAPYDVHFRLLLDPAAPSQVRWLRTTGRVFFDAHGRPRRFDGVTQDVTAERQLEESLRQTLLEKNESLQTLELVNETGQALAAELHLETLVQGVTDAATQLSKAAFGAFFYNVLDDRGQSYMLYTLAGVPKEAFSRFPMPRATRVFEPTFKGAGIIRSDDITRDPRYGHNPPHHGMPEGHLPVRSYLAVPVTSRSGEVIGGLFFGHPSPGVFTVREEKLVAALAAQVAVAMDNARLFQRAQEAITARDTFLSIASHELRTPITSMKMHAQHMRKRIDSQDPSAFTPERVTRLVEQTERSIGGLSRLVEDMLDISRIAIGRLNIQLEQVDLGELTRDVVERFRPQLSEAGHALELHLASGIVGRWDRYRLEQVLTNLLTNALKYAPGAPLRISTLSVGDSALLEVHDAGPGIPPESQHRIFERFERLVAAKNISGLGLGLHIARHITEAHGGTIRVRSAVGEGARFTVELPIAGPADTPVTPSS
ncbi:PAS domain-containing protein [Pyxidicoccus xibeiensis]|uniref:PAS domain-containing protein n=1 Tax=Pyxidicoccus xibeiensis TaxID=2906759 RepID=UPI0020A796DA|nr:PAS domain-containing protein [Pyxidicoccus xibeiensis]MCP3137133.1 PAS domain-containing protein [Pyxidicoccus xibeiensis]